MRYFQRGFCFLVVLAIGSCTCSPRLLADDSEFVNRHIRAKHVKSGRVLTRRARCFSDAWCDCSTFAVGIPQVFLAARKLVFSLFLVTTIRGFSYMKQWQVSECRDT
jgi:hypothetical protein